MWFRRRSHKSSYRDASRAPLTPTGGQASPPSSHRCKTRISYGRIHLTPNRKRLAYRRFLDATDITPREPSTFHRCLLYRPAVPAFTRNLCFTSAGLAFLGGIGFFKSGIFLRTPSRFFLLRYRRFFFFVTKTTSNGFLSIFAIFSLIIFLSSSVIYDTFFIKNQK